jgi:hypothetical protein
MSVRAYRRIYCVSHTMTYPIMQMELIVSNFHSSKIRIQCGNTEKINTFYVIIIFLT